MVLNVIEPAHARYIGLEADLEIFLKDKYGKEYPHYDYNIEVGCARSRPRRISSNYIYQHVCDRWTFEAPELIEEVSSPEVLSARSQTDSK